MIARTLSMLMVAMLGLAGCQGTMFNAQVARFHQLTPDDLDKTFVLIPYEEQKGSLEFRQYAASVASHLTKHGFVQASPPDSAEYAVFIKYSIGGGKTVTGSLPLYGQTGGGTTYQSGSVTTYSGGTTGYGTYAGTSYTTPTFGVIGSVPYSTTNYTRRLGLAIIDLKNSTKENTRTVYEATVVSTGSASTFATVAECIISAVFKDFPGESGKTTRVKLAADTCVK